MSEQTNMMTWGLYESILKNYYEFYELYVRNGLDEIIVSGVTVNIHDVLNGINDLPERQRQAVVLMCLENMREVDAAAEMLPGSRWSSPVGAYKRTGLSKIVERLWSNDDDEMEPTPPPVNGVHHRTVPARGRVFCRECDFQELYDGVDGFVESVRELQKHSCGGERNNGK